MIEQKVVLHLDGLDAWLENSVAVEEEALIVKDGPLGTDPAFMAAVELAGKTVFDGLVGLKAASSVGPKAVAVLNLLPGLVLHNEAVQFVADRLEGCLSDLPLDTEPLKKTSTGSACGINFTSEASLLGLLEPDFLTDELFINTANPTPRLFLFNLLTTEVLTKPQDDLAFTALVQQPGVEDRLTGLRDQVVELTGEESNFRKAVSNGSTLVSVDGALTFETIYKTWAVGRPSLHPDAAQERLKGGRLDVPMWTADVNNIVKLATLANLELLNLQ